MESIDKRDRAIFVNFPGKYSPGKYSDVLFGHDNRFQIDRVEYDVVFEINPEAAVYPFGNRRVSDWSVAIIGFTEIVEYVIHVDAAPGQYL